MKKGIMKQALLGLLCGLLLLTGCKTIACAEEEEKWSGYPRGNFDWLFGQYLWELYDENKDNYLSVEEIEKITELDLRECGLRSVRGISYLTNLKKLDIRNNELEALDVSKNTKLTSLKCSNNYLTKLDVSENTLLKTLWCSDNMISALNLSKNTLLTSVKASNNDLGYIDLTNNTEITEVAADNNASVLNMKKNDAGQYYYDLSTLKNFDVSKASNFSAGTLEGSNLIIPSDVWEVTYTYKMRKGFNQTFTLHCFHPVKINKTNFPDDVFRQYVSDNLDTNPKNGSISYAEAAAIERIDVKDGEQDVSSLQGIEHFFALRSLNCSYQGLTTLDVSKNRNLVSIYASVNKLEKLNVSKNARLESLDMSNNPLTGINVKNLKKLSILDLSSTNISSLDVSNNIELWRLELFACPGITTLDVTSNKGLHTLFVSGTSITSLDLSNNVGLDCLSVSGCPIKTIDVSNMPYLDTLFVANCGLQKLNVKKNPELSRLDCSGNELTTLDLSANSEMSYLECFYNKLTALDVSKCTKLSYLDCSHNQIEKYTGTSSPYLWLLDCSENKLTSLSVSKNEDLQDLNCSENKLTSLSVSKNEDLRDLNCSYNDLTKLNLSNNTKLRSLDCCWNDIGKIDLSANTMLTSADVHLNPLKNLDVSKNTELQKLVCRYCALTSLDLTNCTKLNSLDCRYNSYYYHGDRNNKGEFVVDLTALPGNFDVSKSGNWSGGTVEGTTLTIPVTSEKVTYTYDCGQGKTVKFEIEPIAPELEITSQPKDVTVSEGGTASFQVKASTTVQTYQWKKSTDGGKTWVNSSSSGSKTDTLQMTVKASYNGYLFKCVVTDAVGKKAESEPAKLTVTGIPPVITIQPADQTVTAGGTATFKVAATGDGLTYRWKKSTDGGKTWVNSSSTGATTDTLTMTTKASYNGLQFKCIVTDQYGKSVTSKAVTLTVHAAVAITTQPANQTVTAGGTATFKIAATGDGLTYRWKKSTDGGKTWVNSSSTGAATNTLTMTTKASYNGLQFKCIVTDQYGKSVTSNTAILTIK